MNASIETKAVQKELFFTGLALILSGCLALEHGWPLCWWGIGFAVIGAGYARLAPVVFGKTKEGGRRRLQRVVLLPYLVSNYLTWYLRHFLLTKEDVCNEIAPGIWLGRRPLDHELPPAITTVVDLTAEFTASEKIRRLNYICLPTLDGMAPPASAFGELIYNLAQACDQNIYIHCAAGHGRSAAVAVALLVERGIANDLTEAEQLIKNRRPRISIKAPQKALLNEWFRSRHRPKKQKGTPVAKRNWFRSTLQWTAQALRFLLLGIIYICFAIGAAIGIGVVIIGGICKFICDFHENPVCSTLWLTIIVWWLFVSWINQNND